MRRGFLKGLIDSANGVNSQLEITQDNINNEARRITGRALNLTHLQLPAMLRSTHYISNVLQLPLLNGVYTSLRVGWSPYTPPFNTVIWWWSKSTMSSKKYTANATRETGKVRFKSTIDRHIQIPRVLNSFTARYVDSGAIPKRQNICKYYSKLLVSNGKIAAKRQYRPLEAETTLILVFGRLHFKFTLSASIGAILWIRVGCILQ